MTAESSALTPDTYAALFAYDLHRWCIASDRAAQTDAGHIGASDFTCRQRMRYIMAREPATDAPSKWAAFCGTALDREIQAARQAANPNLLFQQRLQVTLPGGHQMWVTPDEIDPDEPSVTDWKSKNGLAIVRRTFSDEPHRIQRHLQYLACLQNGIIHSEQGVVRNVYVDRSGADDQPHVEQEPFSPEIVALAGRFVEDVQYALQHGEDAWRDQPRQWCRNYCQWFTACRGFDADDAGRALLDERTDADAAAYVEAGKQRDEAAQLRAELRGRLLGLTGTTRSGLRVRTTVVNGKNGSYEKLEVAGP